MTAALAQRGCWDNIRYYGNDPKLWAVVGIAGTVAAIVLKVEIVALFSLYVLYKSITCFYDQYKSREVLEELNKQERDYNQWMTQLVSVIAPEGVVNSAEDIDLTAQPREFFERINEGIQLHLKPHTIFYNRTMQQFQTLHARYNLLVDRAGFNGRVERMMRNRVFEFYQDANRHRPNQEELRVICEENIQRGMSWL